MISVARQPSSRSTCRTTSSIVMLSRPAIAGQVEAGAQVGGDELDVAMAGGFRDRGLARADGEDRGRRPRTARRWLPGAKRGLNPRTAERPLQMESTAPARFGRKALGLQGISTAQARAPGARDHRFESCRARFSPFVPVGASSGQGGAGFRVVERVSAFSGSAPASRREARFGRRKSRRESRGPP
jgi:hypothetical protein